MKLKDLPITAEIICCEYEGWIIGSAANPEAKINRIIDIDIIVPFYQWRKVSKIVAWVEGAELNKHGGTRFKQDGIMVDVWPDTLAANMVVCLAEWVWFPKQNIRFKKVSE